MKKFIVETDGTESAIYTAHTDCDEFDDAIDAARPIYYYYETKRDTKQTTKKERIPRIMVKAIELCRSVMRYLTRWLQTATRMTNNNGG